MSLGVDVGAVVDVLEEQIEGLPTVGGLVDGCAEAVRGVLAAVPGRRGRLRVWLRPEAGRVHGLAAEAGPGRCRGRAPIVVVERVVIIPGWVVLGRKQTGRDVEGVADREGPEARDSGDASYTLVRPVQEG